MIAFIENNLLKIWAWTFLIYIPSYTILAFMLQTAEFDLLERIRADKRKEEFKDSLGT